MSTWLHPLTGFMTTVAIPIVAIVGGTSCSLCSCTCYSAGNTRCSSWFTPNA